MLPLTRSVYGVKTFYRQVLITPLYAQDGARSHPAISSDTMPDVSVKPARSFEHPVVVSSTSDDYSPQPITPENGANLALECAPELCPGDPVDPAHSIG